jgi:hypothetical protein
MGYRVSKSNNTNTIELSVKEQRADGSWRLCGNKRLRCALMGDESHYPVKILPKPRKRFISTNQTISNFNVFYFSY